MSVFTTSETAPDVLTTMDRTQLAEHLKFAAELGVAGVSRDPAWRTRAQPDVFQSLESLGMAKSRSEARRLLAQRAVSVDGHRIDDPASSLTRGSYLLQVGKRRFVRLSLGESGSETAS